MERLWPAAAAFVFWHANSCLAIPHPPPRRRGGRTMPPPSPPGNAREGQGFGLSRRPCRVIRAAKSSKDQSHETRHAPRLPHRQGTHDRRHGIHHAHDVGKTRRYAASRHRIRSRIRPGPVASSILIDRGGRLSRFQKKFSGFPQEIAWQPVRGMTVFKVGESHRQPHRGNLPGRFYPPAKSSRPGPMPISRSTATGSRRTTTIPTPAS